MTADSLFDAPGYRSAVSIVISSPAALRGNPGLMAEAVRAMAAFRTELGILLADPANLLAVPAAGDLAADPGLAGRLLGDPEFIRSLMIRTATDMLESAAQHITAALQPT
ncbi:MAG: hypothetical protein RLZZ373_3176 [Pseudomonadota bacterium]|jgi:hypothetical protein